MMPGSKVVAVDIEGYKTLVDRCARERLDYVIPNGSPEHARVLIAKLLETARNSAAIVSGELIDTTGTGVEVYGFADVVTSAQNFLRRQGSKLKIILERRIDKQLENRFLAEVINDPLRKGQVAIYSDTGAVNATKTPHLMVTDALGYRLEIDNSNVEAFANFGDAPSAKEVLKLFDGLEMYIQQLGKQCSIFRPQERFALV
jgi:hypothetical protein